MFSEPLTIVADEVIRLDQFLAHQFPDQSRTKLAQMIHTGTVQVNGKVRKPSYKLAIGDVVETEEFEGTPIHNLEPFPMNLEVPYEDEELLVVVKPRGVATHPAPGLREATLVNALLARNHGLSEEAGSFRPGIVHRLDKETTGLLLIAKNDVSHRELADQISERTATRMYFGLCHGALPEKFLRIEAPMARDPRDRRKMTVDPKGKFAVTHVKRISIFNHQTLFAAKLETGRTHQIRVHLSAAGYPLVGDTIYCKTGMLEGPLQLHAALLKFIHPSTKVEKVIFQSPPEDFIHREACIQSILDDWN